MPRFFLLLNHISSTLILPELAKEKEPLHEIEEPVLFRHTKNVQGELRKMAFTYSPLCFRLINMADHNRAGKPSILPETRPQRKSNCNSRSAFFTLVRHQNHQDRSVFTDASSDVVRQAVPYPKSLQSLHLGCQRMPLISLDSNHLRRATAYGLL